MEGKLTAVETPLYQHDCETCTFLGRYQAPNAQITDLYFCASEPTVIARWSSDGPDYTSGLAFGIYHSLKGDRDHALAQAFTRACERGLLSTTHPKVARYIANSTLMLLPVAA
jgi:hypothetical protein